MIETKEIKVRRTEENAKNRVEFHIGRNSTSPWVAIEVYATHLGGTGQLGCPSGSLGHQKMLVGVFQNYGQLRLSY
jgi:hypothetical protein